jgi:hypothetical protein
VEPVAVCHRVAELGGVAAAAGGGQLVLGSGTPLVC